MDSPVMQVFKFLIFILIMLFLFILAVTMYRASQYTQFANESRQIISNSGYVAGRVKSFYPAQSYQELNNEHGKLQLKSYWKAYRNWYDQKHHTTAKPTGLDSAATGSNNTEAIKAGNRLNQLEKDYDYMFTIKPKRVSTHHVGYGHEIIYAIKIRVPYISASRPSISELGDNNKCIRAVRWQEVTSDLANDSTQEPKQPSSNS